MKTILKKNKKQNLLGQQLELGHIQWTTEDQPSTKKKYKIKIYQQNAMMRHRRLQQQQQQQHSTNLSSCIKTWYDAFCIFATRLMGSGLLHLVWITAYTAIAAILFPLNCICNTITIQTQKIWTKIKWTRHKSQVANTDKYRSRQQQQQFNAKKNINVN